MSTHHKFIIGDSRNLSMIGDNAVQLIVTSPPYWQLKDYGAINQIGFHDSYEEYINNLNNVWMECFRVLHPGCRLCINIGDQFARSVYYGRYKVIPIRTEIIKFCEILGMDYMGAIIWQKATTTNTTGGAVIMGSFPYPRNGILKIDYEFILIFKKLGDSPRPSDKQKNESIITKGEWNTYFSSHWNFPGVRQHDHLAMFPEELPARLIKMFSFTGETVFDPFMGSGTTALAARNLNRNSIGYEINPNFVPIMKQKMGFREISFDDIKYEFTIDEIKEKIIDPPYVFRDPHKLDKKIDPRRLSFSSKIDNEINKEDEFFSVKSLVTPNKLLLSNGITVRLIGVKSNPISTEKAIEFLHNKTKGQKVFLRYDAIKYDENNQLLVYLYLKNKTFINAHLIKQGLVDVDESINFKYKNKFINLSGGVK